MSRSNTRERLPRVLHGGSWYSLAAHCRLAVRGKNVPDILGYYPRGFRVVRVLKAQQDEVKEEHAKAGA